MRSKNSYIIAKLRNAHNQKRKFRKVKRRKYVLEQKARGLSVIINNYSSDIQPYYEAEYINLTVPSNLDLNTNFAETVKFVSDLRLIIRNGRKKVKLYFDVVNKIGPAALLYLTAEIFRIRRQYPNRLTGTYPVNDDIANLLHGMGFYKLMGVYSNVEGTLDDIEEVYVMKFTSDVGNIGNQIYAFLLKLQSHMNLSKLELGRIYGAIDEAMTNVTDHAFKPDVNYTKDNGPIIPMRNRWWLGGYVDGTTGEVFFMMHDQGAGIPSTLPLTLSERFGLDAINNAFKAVKIISPKDSDYIKLAVSSEKTGTGLDYRGRGFARMRKLVEQMGSGILRVLSLKGEYIYSKDNGIVDETTFDHDETIAGTIVLWQFKCKLKGELENGVN